MLPILIALLPLLKILFSLLTKEQAAGRSLGKIEKRKLTEFQRLTRQCDSCAVAMGVNGREEDTDG